MWKSKVKQWCVLNRNNNKNVSIPVPVDFHEHYTKLQQTHCHFSFSQTKKLKGNKNRCQTLSFFQFSSFFPFLLFYSRKNIKHSENIFHILRAIQNVLHGFSSWNLFFFSFFNFKHIHRVSDACTCTITKIKLTNKRREEKGGTEKHMGQNGEEMKRSKNRGQEWREREGHITGEDREKDSYRGEEKRSNTSSHAKSQGPKTFYQSWAFIFSSRLGIDENVQFGKGCHIIAVHKLLSACLAILAFA